MGFASTLVSPPEGDMGHYLASLERLLALGPRVLLPGHGAPVEDGAARLRDLLAHRRAREREVLAALDPGPATAEDLAERLYAALPPALRRAGERNILAHLLDLRRRGLVAAQGPVSDTAAFARLGGLDAAKPGC
jgi:hydroxyacylglutathione hydrolase